MLATTLLLHTIDERIYNILMEQDVAIGIIVGGIRKGKSVLGYGCGEELHRTAKKDIFEFGLPSVKEHLLPEHVKPIYNLDCLPDGCALISDEAYREFYSRESMTHRNKFIDTLAALSGQKGLKSLYITQQARRLEKGIVSSVDFILFKKPSLLQLRFDRSELKETLAEVYKEFSQLQPPEGMDLNAYQKRCTYVYSENFKGMVENSNVPPEWWNEDISKAYAGVPLESREEDGMSRKEEIVRAIEKYTGKENLPRLTGYDEHGVYTPKSRRKES